MKNNSSNIEQISADIDREDFCPGWQETFDAAMDIIAIISTDFRILKLNKAGIESLGKSPEEIIGQKCYEVVHGLTCPIAGCPCKKAIETGKGFRGEITDRGRQYLTTASPIYDHNNEFKAFAHTVKDITDHKKAQDTLKKAHDTLEKLVEERTEELLNANKKLLQEIDERIKSEQALTESESVLEEQRKALQDKNMALREIIAQVENEKNKIREEITTNLERIVLPTLDKIKLNEHDQVYIDLLRKQLENLTSSYGNKITTLKYSLSPREIEICNLIKTGMPTKEISKLLNISNTTVDKHRRNIRQKLGLSNKSINLVTYLNEMEK